MVAARLGTKPMRSRIAASAAREPSGAVSVVWMVNMATTMRAGRARPRFPRREWRRTLDSLKWPSASCSVTGGACAA